MFLKVKNTNRRKYAVAFNTLCRLGFSRGNSHAPLSRFGHHETAVYVYLECNQLAGRTLPRKSSSASNRLLRFGFSFFFSFSPSFRLCFFFPPVHLWHYHYTRNKPLTPIHPRKVFNISAPATTIQGFSIPPFTAYCHGFAAGIPLASAFTNCTSNAAARDDAGTAAVSARVYPTNDTTQCHVAVSYAVSGE